MKKLLSVPAALPFLVAVFLNAFVDLGHKIVIQNTVFKIHDGSEQVILTAIINGLILLPFILLFSPAGFVSDRYPKHKVMRAVAWGAVVLTSGITLSYAMGWFWLAFAMTFLLAVQSAFYSPAKYGYLKGFFGKQRLAEANGLVQAVSIVAILSGTFAFSILFEMRFPEGVTDKGDVIKAIAPVGLLLILNSLIELVMMYRLPNVDDTYENTHEDTDEKTDEKADENNHGSMDRFSVKDYLTGRSLVDNLKPILQRQSIRLAIIGLAMFWSIGQVLLATFPAFAKETLGELNTIVIQGILAATGIGIALGSTIAGRCSRNYIETGLIPLGAMGIAVGLFMLPTLESTAALALNFMFIGTMGGLFIIPLNALIQFYAKDTELGKTLAANNLIQNSAMLSFLVLTVVFALIGISSAQLLTLIAVIAVIGGCYTVFKLPQSLVRFLLTFFMSRHYKVKVQGMQNIPEEGGVLLLGNHITWVDWAIVQIACPRPVKFVMHKRIYERWYLSWFFKLFGCIPIEAGASSKGSLETVAAELNNGQVVCLFPEGLLSRTGHLAEFRKGYERAAELADESVKIVPFYLRGLWGSQFSRSSDRLKETRAEGWGRDLIVAFGDPLAKNTKADVLKRRIFDLSVHSWNDYVQTLPSLPSAWIDSVKKRKPAFALADTLAGDKSQPLSSAKLLAAATAFAKRIQQHSPEQNIGLLVPTSAGGVIANMAGLLAGKTLVNLNYTASIEALKAAIEQAEIKTLYTSERFLKKLVQRGIDLSPVLEKVTVVKLEGVKSSIKPVELTLRWLSIKCLPASVLKLMYCKPVEPTATAAILFSSGSEGLPKGVKLSHQNIMANIKQIADVLNTQHNDSVMASLPLFHAFGLTVTQFMPLIEGLPMVCHADPTDALGIAKAVAKYKVTILCGTSTFLRLYCRNNNVHPLMMESLRIVVSGAEKLNPDVRAAFKMKFNRDIYEGYGTTETTPVASVNIPDAMDYGNYRIQKGGKLGSVGMPLPGTTFKVVDPESFVELPTGEDGMILIGGVQVMQGYLNNPEKTEQVIRNIDGLRWYVTGDKGHLDADGYLTIVDRYSRFAKLGGEMISLAAVEQRVVEALKTQLADDDIDVIAINIPDDKKGESILLLTELDIDQATLRTAMAEQQCNPLMIPANVITVESLPKLGSGKTDFTKAKHIALMASN